MTPKTGAAHGSLITTWNVQQALESLHSKTETSSPLSNLCLIGYMLADYLGGASTHARQCALYDVLISFITYELVEQRANFHLPAPQNPASCEQVIVAIAADARTKNLELLGLSYIYYRYVWADSSVNYRWFACAGGVDQKIVELCHVHAINWLTGKLQAEESMALDRHLQDAIEAALPPHTHHDSVRHNKAIMKTIR